jgi:hypothetical protein
LILLFILLIRLGLEIDVIECGESVLLKCVPITGVIFDVTVVDDGSGELIVKPIVALGDDGVAALDNELDEL